MWCDCYDPHYHISNLPMAGGGSWGSGRRLGHARVSSLCWATCTGAEGYLPSSRKSAWHSCVHAHVPATQTCASAACTPRLYIKRARRSHAHVAGASGQTESSSDLRPAFSVPSPQHAERHWAPSHQAAPQPHPHTGTVPLGFTRQTPLSLLGPAPQLWGLVCGTLEPCEPQGAHVPCSASAPRPSPWPGPVPTGHPSQLDQGLQGFRGRREQRRGAPARCHQAERGEVAPAPGLPWAFPPPQAKKPGGPSGRPLRKGSWPPSAMA